MDHSVPAAETGRQSVDAGDSYEHWHHVTCRNYSNSELRRHDDGPFAARISMRPFGPLALSHVSSEAGAIRLIRGAADIARDQRDHFLLFLVQQGEIGVAQDGREARAQAGDFFVYDQTRPLTLDLPPGYRSWMLSIPRPMLEARIRTARSWTACRIAGSSKFGALVGSIIPQLDNFVTDTATDATERIGAATVDIIATALQAEAGGPAEIRHLGRHLTVAEAFMRTNLQDPELGIEKISRALHMSPRTLNRAFANVDTTPMRWLWRQRLEACNRALTDGRPESVTEIALSHGFNDVSHFSRAFKKAFGRSPRALRRR